MLHITLIVLCEVVWVLSYHYNLKKEEIMAVCIDADGAGFDYRLGLAVRCSPLRPDRRPGGTARVLQAFGHPGSAALVKRHRHRVHEVGLGRAKFDREPFRHGHLGDRFGRRVRLVRRLGSCGVAPL